MKNERGLTLVELLAALAIVGIIIAVIVSVLSTGASSAERTSSKQKLQQEANYILEAVRKEYLENSDELIILKDGSTFSMIRGTEARILSEGYQYELVFDGIIDPAIDEEFHLTVKDGDFEFSIKTTLSKLR